jgi:alkanesulfonate monooxygenase
VGCRPGRRRVRKPLRRVRSRIDATGAQEIRKEAPVRISLPGRTVEVFTISPRTIDPELYWTNIESVSSWSEVYDCTGILIFTGNDVYVEPWLVAQRTVAETSLCPLVAVNPVYMHPFTVAKMISSIAYLHRRPVFLNMVTGTAVSYLEGLGDDLDHDQRYDRLLEYITIVSDLVDWRSRTPTTFSGTYYDVANLQTLPPVPYELQPRFLLAGQSDAARRVCEECGAISMRMLPPELDAAGLGARGVHFGVVTRETEDAAWDAARRLLPRDDEGRLILEASMANTDSVWKSRLKQAAGLETSNPHYWLDPFLSFKADCPYFVGAYDAVRDLVVQLVEGGVDTVILDIPAHEEEFRHVDIAFRQAGDELAGSARQVPELDATPAA